MRGVLRPQGISEVPNWKKKNFHMKRHRDLKYLIVLNGVEKILSNDG